MGINRRQRCAHGQLPLLDESAGESVAPASATPELGAERTLSDEGQHSSAGRMRDQQCPDTGDGDDPEKRAVCDRVAEWLARGAIAAARRAIIAR